MVDRLGNQSSEVFSTARVQPARSFHASLAHEHYWTPSTARGVYPVLCLSRSWLPLRKARCL